MTVMDQALADASEDLAQGADVCAHTDDAATCTRCVLNPVPVGEGDVWLNNWRCVKRVPFVNTLS